MKFIIPIQNLVIDSIIELDNIIILPAHFEIEDDLIEDDFLSPDKRDSILNTLNLCAKEYVQFYSSYVVALFEYPFSSDKFSQNIPIEEFAFLEKICYKVDRALDYLRLTQCYFGNREILPGIPGIIGNFRRGIVIDVENKLSRELLGHVYNIYTNPGIGLYVDFINNNDSFYKIMSDINRTDVVYNTCRGALARVNEAMYFNNINTSFVYLMSTLEMLASHEYIQFKKVKTYILAFVATNKTDYYQKSERLKNISKTIREQVVHNGKNLYDLFDDHNEASKLLNFLTELIVLYCEQVITLNIKDFDTLVIERNRRINLFE